MKPTEAPETLDEPTTLYDEAVSLSYWLAKELGEHVDVQSDGGETLTDTVKRLVDKRTNSAVQARDLEARQAVERVRSLLDPELTSLFVNNDRVIAAFSVANALGPAINPEPTL